MLEGFIHDRDAQQAITVLEEVSQDVIKMLMGKFNFDYHTAENLLGKYILEILLGTRGNLINPETGRIHWPFFITQVKQVAYKELAYRSRRPEELALDFTGESTYTDFISYLEADPDETGEETPVYARAMQVALRELNDKQFSAVVTYLRNPGKRFEDMGQMFGISRKGFTKRLYTGLEVMREAIPVRAISADYKPLTDTLRGMYYLGRGNLANIRQFLADNSAPLTELYNPDLPTSQTLQTKAGVFYYGDEERYTRAILMHDVVLLAGFLLAQGSSLPKANAELNRLYSGILPNINVQTWYNTKNGLKPTGRMPRDIESILTFENRFPEGFNLEAATGFYKSGLGNLLALGFTYADRGRQIAGSVKDQGHHYIVTGLAVENMGPDYTSYIEDQGIAVVHPNRRMPEMQISNQYVVKLMEMIHENVVPIGEILNTLPRSIQIELLKWFVRHDGDFDESNNVWFNKTLRKDTPRKDFYRWFAATMRSFVPEMNVYTHSSSVTRVTSASMPAQTVYERLGQYDIQEQIDPVDILNRLAQLASRYS